jgi:hypothetical protein
MSATAILDCQRGVISVEVARELRREQDNEESWTHLGPSDLALMNALQSRKSLHEGVEEEGKKETGLKVVGVRGKRRKAEERRCGGSEVC